jgi:hypothetical protein
MIENKKENHFLFSIDPHKSITSLRIALYSTEN